MFTSLIAMTAALLGQPLRSSPPPPPPPPSGLTPPRLRSGSISTSDYPVAAIRAGAEGTAVARLEITPRGRVAGCAVTRSAGHVALDQTTCAIAGGRLQFFPARDARRRPVAGIYYFTIRWELPEPVDPPTPEQARR